MEKVVAARQVVERNITQQHLAYSGSFRTNWRQPFQDLAQVGEVCLLVKPNPEAPEPADPCTLIGF